MFKQLQAQQLDYAASVHDKLYFYIDQWHTLPSNTHTNVYQWDCILVQATAQPPQHTAHVATCCSHYQRTTLPSTALFNIDPSRGRKLRDTPQFLASQSRYSDQLPSGCCTGIVCNCSSNSRHYYTHCKPIALSRVNITCCTLSLTEHVSMSRSLSSKLHLLSQHPIAKTLPRRQTVKAVHLVSQRAVVVQLLSQVIAEAKAAS